MVINPRLTLRVERYINTEISNTLQRLAGRAACAGIPAKPSARSRRSNKSVAEKARTNHHGTHRIPARPFIFAPSGGLTPVEIGDMQIVPPEYWRELKSLIKEIMERGSARTSYVQHRRGDTDKSTQEYAKQTRGSAFGMREKGQPFLEDRMTGYQALLKIAEAMAEMQRDTIMGRYLEPNAKQTIRSKRSKKVVPPDLPLYETGKLLNAIQGWVE